MLSWFDEEPSRYLAICGLAAMGGIAIVLRSLFKPDPLGEKYRHDWRWGFVLLLLLVAGRWPGFFVTREYNPDESQLIAGAITLRHDPVFWRSVDGITAGPLDFFALLPVGTLLGRDSYLSARLTGVGLIFGALLLAHATIARVHGSNVARIATLPAVVFEAFSTHRDFLHYSTELVPVFLLSLAGFLVLPPTNGLRGWKRNLLLGFILGAVPFSKLQVTPIGALGGLALLFAAFKNPECEPAHRRRNIAALLVGAALPAAFLGVVLTATDQWQHALVPYFWSNVSYVGHGLGTLRQLGRDYSAQLAQPGSLFVPWFVGGIVLLGLISRWARPTTEEAAKFLYIAVSFFVCAAVCVIFPRRPFLHYMQLLVVPFTLLVGAVVGSAFRRWRAQNRPRSQLGAVAALAIMLVPMFFMRARGTQTDLGKLQAYQLAPMETPAKIARHYADPGEALGLWGWHARYYVEANFRQATRDAYSTGEIYASENTAYYRARYLADLQKNLPPIFIDGSVVPAEMPGGIAHELYFPALGAFIRSHYTLVETINRERIYVRNDRVMRNQP